MLLDVLDLRDDCASRHESLSWIGVEVPLESDTKWFYVPSLLNFEGGQSTDKLR